mgnify:CR=1 FL=1
MAFKHTKLFSVLVCLLAVSRVAYPVGIDPDSDPPFKIKPDPDMDPFPDVYPAVKRNPDPDPGPFLSRYERHYIINILMF